MRRRAFTLFAAAAALGLAMATPVPAQQATSTVDELQEIVVTARRVEERLQDVPISISVFNQQQLADRNIVTASDLVLYTPSLSSSPRFGPDNASFAIRGFVQEGPTSPSVAVYFADVVAPRAQGGTTAGNGAGVGSLFDLQNVEVLKGPQGTLFGRNTTGGAILLVPKKPTSDFAFQCTDVIGLAAGAQGAVGFISSSATHYFFRDIGAYSQATYKFTEQWSLTAGIRYTNDWSSGLGQAVHLNFPAPDTPLYSCANPVPLVQGGTAAQIQANNSLCNFYREENSARPTWLIDLDYKPARRRT